MHTFNAKRVAKKVERVIEDVKNAPRGCMLSFTGKNDRVIRGEVITNEIRLKRLAKKLKKVDEFAFDTETDSLRVQWTGEVNLVGISICFGSNDVYYIPVGHFFDDDQLPLGTVLKALKPAFERHNVRILGHNLKYDMHVLSCFGINIITTDLFDTMVGSFTIDENEQKGLKHLTSVIYGVKQEKYDGCLATVTNEEKKAYGLKASNKPPFQLVRIAIGAPYAMADAYWTWRHYVDWQLDQLREGEVEKIYLNVVMPFLRTLYNMERRGVNVNKDRLLEMQRKADSDLIQLEYDIVEIAGVEFNPSSGQQIGEILFGYKKFNKQNVYSGNKHLVDNNFGFPILSTTGGGAPSTGETELRALLALDYRRDERKLEGLKMIRLILKYKKLSKLKSTFIDGLLGQIYEDGKIHPTFNLGGATSGRLSCSQPNLQQLPRPVEMPSPPKIQLFIDKDEYDVDEVMEDCKAFFERDEDGNICGVKKSIKTKLKNRPNKHYFKFDLARFNKAYNKYLDDKEEADFWKFYEIRDAFIPDNPEDEVILALDFSNLEMRLLAHFSNDPLLMETFNNDADAHGSTAVNMFNLDCTPDEVKKLYKHLRQIAKTINFLDNELHTA